MTWTYLLFPVDTFGRVYSCSGSLLPGAWMGGLLYDALGINYKKVPTKEYKAQVRVEKLFISARINYSVS